SARTKALAEAAAAKKQAEYDRIIAEKEHEGDSAKQKKKRHQEGVSKNAKHRTQQWVDAQDNTKSVNQRQDGYTSRRRSVFSHNTSSPQTTKIQRDVECIETIIATNKQLTSSLARQSLPKCHPDAFGGDATLFHPWKSAFKAMLRDADLSPDQEINYLRQYTKGDAQKLVDSYRKRQYREPASLLQEVWAELEKRFGKLSGHHQHPPEEN
ncbi:hypothetical protein OS493_039592, partial [Desmophyllum pertusum]